jgi:hypothetical protein
MGMALDYADEGLAGRIMEVEHSPVEPNDEMCMCRSHSEGPGISTAPSPTSSSPQPSFSLVFVAGHLVAHVFLQNRPVAQQHSRSADAESHYARYKRWVLSCIYL